MSDWKLPQLRPTGDRDADVFQRQVREALDKAKRDPLLSYSEKRNVDIQGTDTKVAHGLGRVPVGWIITDTTGFGVVRRVSWDAQFATFVATTLVTVSIRFF